MRRGERRCGGAGAVRHAVLSRCPAGRKAGGAIFRRVARPRGALRPLRLQPCADRRALFPPLGRIQPEPDGVSHRRLAAQQDRAHGDRRGAAGVQQPAQAGRRDRHARRHFGRAARCRVRARLPASRIRAFRHRHGGERLPLRGRSRPGAPPARRGERHRERAIQQLRERHLAAAPDPEAAPADLHRRGRNRGLVRARGNAGSRGDGDPGGGLDPVRTGRRLPRGVEAGRTSGETHRDARRLHVLQPKTARKRSASPSR